MTNYDKLVAALRYHADTTNCDACKLYDAGKCELKSCVLHDAADAIEALQVEQKKTVTQIFGEEQMAWEGRCKDLMYQIADLQAQLPKHVEWELIDGVEPMRWGCSRCKYLSWEPSSYCPRCGAKMEVQDG